MEKLKQDYRLLLTQEFTARTRRNPSYSLRAFAKTLGISPASLSQILSGKRPLGKKTALKITERCAMAPDEAQRFLASAMDNSTVRLKEANWGDGEFKELQVDLFRVISDWYHYAILSLGDIEPNDASPEWIAKRLGITRKQAKEAFERLLKLEMVEKIGRGFKQLGLPLRVPTESHNSAIRNYHLQNLQRSQDALELGEAKMELYSAITMAIDEANLEDAREFIKEFRRKICKTLQKGKQERVYTLAVQLFPVSEKVR